jgi:hypothetical protein
LLDGAGSTELFFTWVLVILVLVGLQFGNF